VSLEGDSGEEEKLWIWKKNVPILYDVMYVHSAERDSFSLFVVVGFVEESVIFYLPFFSERE
jgi:hypothetical protein